MLHLLEDQNVNRKVFERERIIESRDKNFLAKIKGHTTIECLVVRSRDKTKYNSFGAGRLSYKAKNGFLVERQYR